MQIVISTDYGKQCSPLIKINCFQFRWFKPSKFLSHLLVQYLVNIFSCRCSNVLKPHRWLRERKVGGSIPVRIKSRLLIGTRLEQDWLAQRQYNVNQRHGISCINWHFKPGLGLDQYSKVLHPVFYIAINPWVTTIMQSVLML